MEKQNLPMKRNMERFMAATGKSESEYVTWASEVGQRMHINTQDKLVCAKLNIYSVGHLVYLATELPDGMPEAEVDGFLIENSMNAWELAKLWKKTKADADVWSCKESTIANGLTCFPKSDFEQWGDKNWLGDVSRGWFQADGLHLDVQVMEMSENSGFEVEIQDVIEFVMKWKPRTYKNPAQVTLKQIEARFREVTTFGLKEYYVEHLIRMCGFEKRDLDVLPF